MRRARAIALAAAAVVGTAAARGRTQPALPDLTPEADPPPPNPSASESPSADPEHAEADSEREHRLVLDPAPLFRHEGLRSQRDGDHTTFRLGDGIADLRLGSDWWSNADDETLPPIDLASRGWKASLQLSHDFGWFRLVAGAGLGQADVGGLGDGGSGRGRYLDLGIALVHSKRLSRWVTWWISLGANYGTWLRGADPALGPGSGYTLGLTIGTTFK